jgi:maltose O-acetyltransferase
MKTIDADASPYSLISRVRRAASVELEALHPAVFFSSAIAAMVPRYVANRLRTRILRLAGWRIGDGTFFAGVPKFSGSGRIRSRLTIGSGGWINVGCTFELNDTITIGDRVAIAHEVMVLTSTHKIGTSHRRAGVKVTSPVSIGDGVWLGARSVILPGVTVGDGAVVSTGAVVTKDVPPNSVVAGAPAMVVVKRLPS